MRPCQRLTSIATSTDNTPRTSEDSTKPDDVLRKRTSDLEAALGRATVRTAKLEAALQHARAQVAWFQRNLFGQKKERTDLAAVEQAWRQFVAEQERTARGAIPTAALPESMPSLQLLLMLGSSPAGHTLETPEDALKSVGIDASAPAHAELHATPATPATPKRRSKHGRGKLPDTLRHETIVLEPDLHEHADDARLVGTDVSYRIGVRPAELLAYVIERRRYAVDLANGKTRFETAAAPAEMIERGLLAPSALAQVLAMKWERHVPYNRTALFFAKSGYELPVSTLSGASIRAVPLASALVDAMTAHAKQIAPYLAIDATGALLQGKEACTRGHTWMRYVENACVLVSFTAKHDASTASEQLDGWTCPFLADGAAVFNEAERSGRGRSGCFSHARRKFFYAVASDLRAWVGLKLLNEIFAIERGLVGATVERRLAVRRERAGPLFEQFISWCRTIGAENNVGPRSLLAKAARYVLNQHDRLKRFLDDGRVPIHNNMTELQIRHFAVGRKNWLFYGSEQAAAAGSVWLSLVLSARMHDLHVETYFRELFRLLPVWPKSRLVELAPHAWSKTRARLSNVELGREYGPVTIPPRG